METPQKKKSHKGGTVVRTEPADMHLFEAEPMAREFFKGWAASLSAKICRGVILRWQGNFPYILMA
jgi:hypothetical protein